MKDKLCVVGSVVVTRGSVLNLRETVDTQCRIFFLKNSSLRREYSVMREEDKYSVVVGSDAIQVC